MHDVFAIYDNNILPRLIMIIIKIIFLYFIEIAHTDDFPSTSTRLAKLISIPGGLVVFLIQMFQYFYNDTLVCRRVNEHLLIVRYISQRAVKEIHSFIHF